MGASNKIIVLCTVLAAMVVGIAPMSKPDCPSTCGNLTIPYPFGMGAGCYLDGFDVDCDQTTSKAYIGNRTNNLEITNISLFPAQIRFVGYAAYDCYNKSGVNYSTLQWWTDLHDGPFTFSDTQNLFVATGCDTIALIQGARGRDYTGGCVSYCGSVEGIVDGTCSGIGCCQSAIPKGLKQFHLTLASFTNHSNSIDFNPCSYAFVVEDSNYTFKVSDLNNTDMIRGHRTVMDWSIGKQKCQAAKSGSINDGYFCVSENSSCIDADNGSGYYCSCNDGYQGNPYLPKGCIDIDECQSQTVHCKGVCTNIPGSYSCECPPGTYGNASGDGCLRKGELPLYAKLGIGFSIGVLLLIVIVTWTYWVIQKRKFMKAKHQFFEHNGGLFLQQKMSRGQSNNFKIYTIDELEKATHDFDPNDILGKGGNGIVYKGVLHDQTTVAIKRSIMVDDKKSAEFANEMLILSQINHANVVKLLGCCLEVEVPILVYEFVPHGTLFNRIHNRRAEVPFPWDLRLKIAIDSAKALSYLHNDASPTILHGDVKSSNILLGEQSKAKVSDFGTSTLARKDKYQFMTLVQGPYGYLDPECLQTCQLTYKSDVYSFGVVLAELITGKKALYKDGSDSSEEEKSLALSFTSCVKRDRLRDILDTDVADEDSFPQIQTVADITVQCLSLRGDERPAMLDVFHELQALGRSGAHPWVSHDLDETERLINWNPDTSTLEQTGNVSMGRYAMNIGGR